MEISTLVHFKNIFLAIFLSIIFHIDYCIRYTKFNGYTALLVLIVMQNWSHWPLASIIFFSHFLGNFLPNIIGPLG